MCTGMSQVIPQGVVQALFAACRSGEFDAANKVVTDIIAEGYPVSHILSQVPTSASWAPFGYPNCPQNDPRRFLRLQLFDVITAAEDIPDEQKAKICKRLAEADKVGGVQALPPPLAVRASSCCFNWSVLLCSPFWQRLVDGADEYLQLMDVASHTMRALCNMNQEFEAWPTTPTSSRRCWGSSSALFLVVVGF